MGKRTRAIGSALILVALIVTGCAARLGEAPAVMVQPTAGADYYVAKEAEEAGSSPAAPGNAAREFLGIERLVIRNATLDIVVQDTEATLTQIQALVKELGGYVVESSTYKYQQGLQASVTFRVPADQLDAALERVRELATEVRHESITGQDVTEEYVDLESRLRHLEATEKRLETFLDEAEDTEAALAVYEQLRQVNAEIEQVKGRMNYLQESAALSMVTLSITPDALAQPIEVGGWRPQGTLRGAFEALIKVLQFLVDALIVIVVLVLPVLVVIAAPIVGLTFGIRALVRRGRARKAARAAQAAAPAEQE
jgi:hypothetical protein